MSTPLKSRFNFPVRLHNVFSANVMGAENVSSKIQFIFEDPVADGALDGLGKQVDVVGVIDGAHAGRKVLSAKGALHPPVRELIQMVKPPLPG
jgi:hypothetical protein